MHDRRDTMTLNQFLSVLRNHPRHTEYVYHTIEDGDTLTSVADKYKLATGTLRALNGGFESVESEQRIPDNFHGKQVAVAVRLLAQGMHRDAILRQLGITFTEARIFSGQGVFFQIGDGTVLLPLPHVEDSTRVVKQQEQHLSFDVTMKHSLPDIPMKDLVFHGEAPNYHDDVLPFARKNQRDKYKLLLGDVETNVPPESIIVRKVNTYEDAGGLRLNTPVISTDGTEKTEVQMVLYFVGEDGINGTRVPSPFSEPYYMDGLLAFISQARCNPFLPVVNEYLNDVMDIHALAISSITVRPVEGFPHVFQVHVGARKFNTYPYTLKPDILYRDMFIWPLFRWHYQKFLHYDRSDPGRRFYRRYNESDKRPLAIDIINEDTMERILNLTDEEQEDSDEIEWERFTFDNSTIVDASFGFINVLTDTPLQGNSETTHQYMGSFDDRMLVVLETSSKEDIEKLMIIQKRLGEYTRLAQNQSHENDFFFRGYMKFFWHLSQVFGLRESVIDHIEISTVDEFPGHYQVALSIRGFDPYQHQLEHLRSLNTAKRMSIYSTSEEDIRTAIEDSILQEKELNRQNLYPDLHLPTYPQLQEALTQTESFRAQRKLTPLQPSISREKLEPHFPSLQHCYVEPDFYFAYDLLDIVSDGMKEIANAPNLGEDTPIVDPENAVKSRTIPALEEVPKMSEKDLYDSMWHDHFFYEARGRMVRAFPTYCMVLIDEGNALLGQQLWDIPYTSRALIDATIHSDANNPISTCQITMHDIYGATQAPFWVKNEHINIIQRFINYLTPEVIDHRRKQMHKRLLNVQAGARLHLRIGYGNLGGQLPVAFNGTLTEITRGPVVEMMFQGDGAELIEPIPAWIDQDNVKNTSLGYGKRPHELIGSVLSDRDWAPFKFTPWFGQGSPLGINHFGYVIRQKQGIRDETDITKNIFPGLLLSPIGTEEDKDDFLEIQQFVNPPPKEEIEDNNSVIYKYTNWWETWVFGALTFGNLEQLQSIIGRFITDPFLQAVGLQDLQRGDIETEMGKHLSFQMWLQGKSPWDIFMTTAATTPHYRFGIHNHQLRSTAFFGLPHWPVRYKFDVDENSQIVEKYKPFMQHHLISSDVDLVYNGMRASSQQIATVAHIQYNEGNSNKNLTLYADRSLRGDRMKSVVVGSSLTSDIGSYRIPFIGKTIDIIPDGLLSLFNVHPGRNLAMLAGKEALRTHMSQMYLGQIGIIGDPTMKPNDLVHLSDTMHNMQGVLEVGSVTHVLSAMEGYRTIIKPNLISTIKDDRYSKLLAFMCSSGVTIALLSNLALYAHGKAVLASMASSMGLTLAGTPNMIALKTGYQAAAASAVSFIKTTISAAKAGGVLAAIKSGLSAAAVGTVVGKGLVIGGPLILGYMVINSIFRAVEDYNRSGDTITIFPIYYKGKPYVTGIDGHENLIPGYMSEDAEEILGVEYGEQNIGHY